MDSKPPPMFYVSKSFGSRAPLTSAMNAAQQGKAALAYLKVVLHLLNENSDELDFKMGRPLQLDDLDNLTSTQMLKIVTFLLRDVVGDKPIYKPTPLTDFNKFGIGNVTYDAGIDLIYHAVKSIFPEDSDLFHYSVLLLPASNPKRTKAVISYIMSFVLMCDNLEEQFNACFNEVIKENEEKIAICNEVDDLKDKISAKIQEKETEKERLPSLQKELQTLENNIRKQQKVLAKLSTEVGKHKAIYESKEAETKNLEQQLDRINMERLSLEQQIVSNPNEIRTENASIKALLDTEMKTREDIGAELEKYAVECDVYESLIKRAHHVIRSIESVIALMEKTKLKIEFYMKTGNEMTSSSRKIEIQKEELHKLSERHSEKLAEVNRIKDKYESELKEILTDIDNTKEQISQTRNRTKMLVNSRHEAIHSIEGMNGEVENFKKEITSCIHYVLEVLPQRKKEKDAEAQKFLEKVAENFSHYSMLKPDDKPDKKSGRKITDMTK